jgi:hypothetical protein
VQRDRVAAQGKHRRNAVSHEAGAHYGYGFHGYHLLIFAASVKDRAVKNLSNLTVAPDLRLETEASSVRLPIV